MTDDVLAKLDRYLNNDKMMGDMIVGSGLGPALVPPIQRLAEMVQRARDEIVALRETIERQKLVLSKGHAQTRDDALEEAARLHENIYPACEHERQKGDLGAGAMGAVIAYRDAIRALKERGDE